MEPGFLFDGGAFMEPSPLRSSVLKAGRGGPTPPITPRGHGIACNAGSTGVTPALTAWRLEESSALMPPLGFMARVLPLQRVAGCGPNTGSADGGLQSKPPGDSRSVSLLLLPTVPSAVNDPVVSSHYRGGGSMLGGGAGAGIGAHCCNDGGHGTGTSSVRGGERGDGCDNLLGLSPVPSLGMTTAMPCDSFTRDGLSPFRSGDYFFEAGFPFIAGDDSDM
jgi:hypothetical protein